MLDFNFLANPLISGGGERVDIGGAGCLITVRRRGTIAALHFVCVGSAILCVNTHTYRPNEAAAAAAFYVYRCETAKHTPVIIAQSQQPQSNLPAAGTRCANNAAIVPNQHHQPELLLFGSRVCCQLAPLFLAVNVLSSRLGVKVFLYAQAFD